MARVKKRIKRKVLLFLIVFFLVVFIGGVLFYFYHKEQVRLEREFLMTKKIESHYGNIVEITKDSILYEKKDGKFLRVGQIAKGEKVSLEKTDITADTKYFKITNIGYYVSYKNVKKSDNLIEKDDRYKNYILFNENIVTNSKTNLYRGDKLVYTVDKGLDEAIVYKNDGGYFIEYFGELLYVKKEDVLSTHSVENTFEEEANGVPVTVYHFIYLNGDNSCNEAICHSENQIREHFNYLKSNNFFTMTTTELRLYLEGNLRVPKKSILITIDDGSRAWNFIPLLEEYKINATLFLISGWYPLEKFQSEYMEVASHTHNLHTPRVCPGGQGSPLKCYDKTKLLEDLTTSRAVLGGTEAFCFPFYEYNDYGISVLQEAGFKMAFIGGSKKATRGVNLFKIPRIPLTDYTTLNQYANYIN